MPVPYPSQFQPSEMNAFGVMCGPAASTRASTVQRVSESCSDVETVSHRMNELLSLCKRRLLTSRRSAQDAEEKLQIAEADLSRIGHDWQSLEGELEVARKLFDSETVSPASNGSSSAVPEESIERARRGWDILGEVMSRSSPRSLPSTTGADRASALLAEALQRPIKQPPALQGPIAHAPEQRPWGQKNAAMFRWLQQQQAHRRKGQAQTANKKAMEYPSDLESPGITLELEEHEELQGEAALKTHSMAVQEERILLPRKKGPTASDFFKVSTVPAPKPQSKHDGRPSKGRNFYALEADRDDTIGWKGSSTWS